MNRIFFDPISFAIRFVNEMRKRKELITNVPSTRRATAIAKLLFSRFMRKRELIPEDYILVAVVTTPYEDQKIARKIAMEILFGEKTEREGIAPLLTQTIKPKVILDELEDYDITTITELKKIALELLIRTQEINKVSPLDTLKFEYNVKMKAILGEHPYDYIAELFEWKLHVIREKGITSMDQLKHFIKDFITKNLGCLKPGQVRAICKLGREFRSILKYSPVTWEKLAAIGSHDKIIAKLKEIIERDLGLATSSIRFLHEAELISDEEFDRFIDKVFSKVKTIQDLYEVYLGAGYFREVENVERIIDESILRLGPKKTFKIASAIDLKFGLNLKDIVFQHVIKRGGVKLEDLVDICVYNREWRELVEKCLSDIFGRDYDYRSLLREYRRVCALAEKCNIPHASFFIKKELSNVRLEILRKSPPSNFLNLLKEFLGELEKPPLEEVLKIGKTKGIPEEQIIMMYGEKIEILMKMYEMGIGTFDDLLSLLQEVKPRQDLIERLLREAMRHKSEQHLAALGHYNLTQIINAARKLESEFPDIIDRIFGSLTAGPGENLLLTWIRHGHSIDPKYREKLKQLAKQILIDLARSYAAKYFGSAGRGVSPSFRTRLYLYDSDADMISINETIDNIILLGKNPLKFPVDYSDIIVHERERGRIVFVCNLDISGSMADLKLCWCAIAVAMLAIKLQREEFACCFFESNTHILKDIDDETELDDIVDELLELKARGGTRLSRALEWSLYQLDKIDAEQKVLLIASDFCIWRKDWDLVEKYLKDICVRHNPNVILLAPFHSYDRVGVQKILNIVNGQFIEVHDIKSLPNVLSQIIRRFT